MKRFFFLSALLFGFLAHGAQAQTLSYNSPSPDSVLFTKSKNFVEVRHAPDSSSIHINLYIIRGFKADKDSNGFDCGDDWIFKGKDVWNVLSNQNNLPFLKSDTVCNNGEYQWSFNVDPTLKSDPVFNEISLGVNMEGTAYSVIITLHPVENHDTFQAKRVELWGDEEPIRTGCIAVPGSSCSTSTSSEAPQELPNAISLKQNYPNPFNPQTTITYQIDAPQHVRLDVFNAQGQRIQTLVDGMRPAGEYSVRFDAASLPSGVYMYRIYTPDGAHTRKMLLIR